jgi:hypothetical protein
VGSVSYFSKCISCVICKRTDININNIHDNIIQSTERLYTENAAVALTWKIRMLLREECEKHDHMLRYVQYRQLCKKLYDYCFICGMFAENWNNIINRDDFRLNSPVNTFPLLPGHVATVALIDNRGTLPHLQSSRAVVAVSLHRHV